MCWPVESKRMARSIRQQLGALSNELRWHFMGTNASLQTFIRMRGL